MTSCKGAYYEGKALRYLRKRGLALLDRNFRTRFGEVDLIMRDGNCLTFVEVRYRTHSRFSTAIESIDERKQQKIICAAEAYLSRHSNYDNDTVRFDVIAFDAAADSPDKVQWLQDAFRA